MSETRQCWICYVEEELSSQEQEEKTDQYEDEISIRERLREKIKIRESNLKNHVKWIKPCNCRGSLQFVHMNCFKTYIAHSKTSLDCSHCKTPYNIIMKDYYFIKLYEILYSFSLFLIFTLPLILGFILCVCVVASYGGLLMYIILGRDALEKMTYFENGQYNFSGICRMILAFIAIPFALIWRRPIFIGFGINLLICFCVIEGPKFSFSNIIFSISPIIFFFYKVFVKVLQEWVIPDSDSFFTGRVYTTNSFLAQFPFPMKDVISVLLLPFLAAFFGHFVFGQTSVSLILLSLLILVTIYDACTILYLFLVKRQQETVQIHEVERRSIENM